jgi:glyoxylase I family protein
MLSQYLQQVHHIAVICSNYSASKKFYTELLGFTAVKETYRAERDSYKLDLALNGNYIIELFSFPVVPPRPSQPEACGLRHLAFAVTKLEDAITYLLAKNIITEAIRTDVLTGKRFTFFSDPDGLPLELYEQ